MANNSEVNSPNPEVESKSVETAGERLEELSNSPETAVERPRNNEEAAERARLEALESAVSVEAGSSERKKDSPGTNVRRRGVISKKEKEASFKRQMKDIQAVQPPINRAFSKLIHNKAVEKASDVVGSTVARPNAILAGSVAVFSLTLTIYVIAKNIGYQLSGSETIASFIVGWTIGLVYDYLRVVITGKK